MRCSLDELFGRMTVARMSFPQASFNTASIVLFLPRLGSGGGFRIGVDAGTTGLATGLGSGQ
jgi:hypothetical protein